MSSLFFSICGYSWLIVCSCTCSYKLSFTLLTGPGSRSINSKPCYILQKPSGLHTLLYYSSTSWLRYCASSKPPRPDLDHPINTTDVGISGTTLISLNPLLGTSRPCTSCCLIHQATSGQVSDV